MSHTFWISTDQLDDEQRNAVEDIPDSASFLLRGPAGSGKTNILLLRAKWLILKKHSHLKIVVFTKSLRGFVEEGCNHYGIDPSIAVTQASFFRRILEEHAIQYELTDEFEIDRAMLAGKIMSLLDSKQISSNYIETLLIDESQDYTDTELRIFKGISKQVVFATDSRQSIYRTTHSPGLLETLVDNNVVELRYHYRSGLKLCKVADAILPDSPAYPRLQGECKYPESKIPSSVQPVSCETFQAQMEAIAANLQHQFSLYPDEKIGVLFPKREQVLQFKSVADQLNLDDRVWVDTIHGAKGWEFRAIHIGGCELLYRMGPTQKRLIYTAILRGKTSAHVYFSGHIPGYLEAALAVIEPPKPNPGFDSLFGVS
jgi:superfamily I DNA/RNA helicase